MRGLTDPRKHEGNPVTWALAAAMLVTSLPALAWPRLQSVFGGIGVLHHPWQVFSSAFFHGGPGFPLLLHLMLNLALMSGAAVLAERLIGSARFLAVTALAILAYASARTLLDPLQANGSSVFIWAYAPILLAGLLEARNRGRPFGEAYQRAKHLLAIMWGVVTVAMTLPLLMRGFSPAAALFYGNAFHLSATAAGLVAWPPCLRHLRRRIEADRYPQSRLDRAAAATACLIPIFFGIILALELAGIIDSPGIGG